MGYYTTLMLLRKGFTEKCLIEFQEQMGICNKSMNIQLFSYYNTAVTELAKLSALDSVNRINQGE